MTNIASWRYWVIIALALTTLACAGRAERRERREEARQERLERREQARQERNERSRQQPQSAAEATSTTAVPALTPVSTAPASDMVEGKVVFMRPSGMGGAVAATVFDVTGSGDSKIIGIINMRGKLSYPVKPGVYTFMVVSEAADFMQVTVAPGKTYYALVRPRMGAWKARFSFEPLRAGDSRAESWERSTRLVNNPSRAEAWYRDNASSVEDKRSRYWPEWNNKPESARAGQTLNAEDGR